MSDKSLNVRVSQDIIDYIELIGEGNKTAGLIRIVSEHSNGKHSADIEAGILFLARYMQTVDFRTDLVFTE